MINEQKFSDSSQDNSADVPPDQSQTDKPVYDQIPNLDVSIDTFKPDHNSPPPGHPMWPPHS